MNGKGETNMATVSIQEAQAKLSDLIHQLSPGEEVVITENSEPVAKLARTEPKKQWPCKAGSAKGKIHIAPDFDEPLVSAPTQPATGAGAATALAKKATETPAGESRWESPIDLCEEKSSVEAAPATDPGRREPRKTWLIALAGSLFGLVAMSVIIITIRDKSGRDTKISVPDDSPVAVEGPLKNFQIKSPETVRGVAEGRGGYAVMPEVTYDPEAEPTADGTGGLPTSGGEAENPMEGQATGATRRQGEPADTALPGPSPKTWTNSLGMKLVRIEPGKFSMGSTENADEQPPHLVEITRPFSLGDREVTQRQYLEVMGVSPSHYKGSDDLPVEQVSWLDAVTFCNKLSEKEERTPCYRINGKEATVVEGNGYRLPTEAEWEYACRSGSTTRFPFGDNEADLGEFAWFDGNSASKTHPVGQKRPNRWGLYDMLGNVYEWCQDWYDLRYYAMSPTSVPPGPSGPPPRVFQGGGWDFDPSSARPAYRDRSPPGARFSFLGFRLSAVWSE